MRMNLALSRRESRAGALVAWSGRSAEPGTRLTPCPGSGCGDAGLVVDEATEGLRGSGCLGQGRSGASAAVRGWGTGLVEGRTLSVPRGARGGHRSVHGTCPHRVPLPYGDVEQASSG